MDGWKHFRTITKHKLLVMHYCFRVGLYRQGLLHDLSKYSWTEFRVGCKYYQGDRSPNNAEREDLGLSYAWLHHKGRNKHHYEYWIDYDFTGGNVLGGMKMPRRYVAEMIMDRISACRVYAKDTYTDASPLTYYLKGKDRLWFVHDVTKQQMEFLLRMLAQYGEEKTLYYIKYYFLKGKKLKKQTKT